MTVLYKKIGRRYVVWGDAKQWSYDPMRAGQFRLTYCPRDGAGRYSYDVTPDTAGFVAAAEIAREAMESAIDEAAKSKPKPPLVPYTKRQLAIIEKFRSDMAAAGAMVPHWWTTSSSRDIALAGVDAVRAWRP